MKWFKHDANAQNDAKLEKLRLRYGMSAYGLYWYCLELIVGNIEAHNITFELEHDAEIIAARTGIHPDQIQEIIRYMVDLQLFENTNGHITCFKIAKRLDASMTSNYQLREIIKEFNKSHDKVMTPSRIDHDSVMREEKRIDKKRREPSSRNFIPPSLEEIVKYCQERKNNIDPENFYYFYESKNWMVGKNKMKDWKAAIITWEKKSPKSNEIHREFI